MAKHDENGDDATAKGKRPKGNRFGEPSFLALCGVKIAMDNKIRALRSLYIYDDIYY